MKQNIKRTITSLLVAGFVLTPLLVGSVASARQSRGSDDTSTTTTTSEDSNDSADDNSSSANKVEVENHVSEMRRSAEQEVEKHKESKGQSSLSDEKRKLVCENRQKAINNKLAAFVPAAQKHLTRLNKVYSDVQAYQVKNNVDVPNYTGLVATADAKKQAATDAVAALQTVAASVDCSDPTSVVKLSTVRDAAKAARTALHEYRKAIRAIVVAIDQVEDSQSSSDDTSSTSATGGTQ